MATLIWLGGTSTDSTVLSNWKDQSTGSAPTSIATTDDFLFNAEGAGNPCVFKQATIATLTTATGWNARITFDNPTLSLTALNFLADSEIAFANSSTAFTFNGNHITTTPFFNHPVVFGGNITYAGSNGRETVSWVFNNNNSDPSFLCDGLYPKITINAIFTTDVSSDVSNTTTGKVECISMTMTSTGKFTNTNLSAASTQKHIHITSSNLATQQLVIENDVFDMRNSKLTLTAANNLKIPCTNDTTNYSGSKPTFFANLGDVVLAQGASFGLKMFVPNGLTLECNSLEIQNGVFLLGGEEPNAASEIHLVKKPKVRGTWNFKPITDGIYRSFGRASQSMFALTAKEAHITDKLTVDGLIDPTGLELTPVGANPGGVAANTLWLNSGDSNKLYHGSSEVGGGGGGGSGTVTSIATSAPITGGTITSTGTIGISAATTSAAGSMSAADKTKLDGIEASATADQTAAEIRTLVESATDSNVFTDADHTKLNGIETSATADQNANEVPVSASPSNYTASSANVESHLSGIDTALGSVSASVAPITLDTGNNRVGINEASPDHDLHVHGSGNYTVKFEHGEGQTLFNKYGHVQIFNDNTSPADGSTLDNPVWQIGQRDGGQLDIACGNISTQLVPATKKVMEFKRVGNTESGAIQIGFFGATAASKTTVAALGAQSAASPAAPAPPGAGDTLHADFDAAITQLNTNINNIQAKLDALITSLSNLGLV